MTRTYGRLWRKDAFWLLQAEPHVIMWAKRIFKRIPGGGKGIFKLSNNPATCRDLEWFCQRFPLTIVDGDELKRQSKKHRDHIARLDKIVDLKYVPRAFELALPAREYQMRGAELFLEKGDLLLADDVGLGKAQPLDSNVLTPAGWKRMGDLHVGDLVIDPDAGVGRVEEIHPQGEKEVFCLFTADGACAQCCDDHLWLLESANDRRRGASRVLPLRDFRNDMVRYSSGQKIRKYFVPSLKPAALALVDCRRLPIAPYLMGVLIGNGCFRELGAVMLSCPDDFILERCRPLLPDGVAFVPANQIDYRISRIASSGPNPLQDAIGALGLRGKHSVEKWVPKEFLFASIEDRLELLRGLMDTDGDCTTGGVSIFNTSSRRLVEDVIFLVGSLGGFTTVGVKEAPKYVHKGEVREGQTAFRVNVRLPINPFLTPRKADRWHAPYMARGLDSAVAIGNKICQCIKVSTKRNLYVTDGFLVTHNTATGIAALTEPSTLPALVVCLAHLPRQWEREINRFAPDLHTHIVKKGTPYELPRFMGRGMDVLIITYHKLYGWQEVLSQYVRSIIFDEAQELRREESMKYLAAKEISSHCQRRLGLSATPVYNFGGEIFNVLNVLSPGCLGTRQEFTTEWCSHTASDKPRLKDPDAFGSYLRENHIMLRRTRKDVGRELAPLSRITHTVESDAEALKSIEGRAGELARLILSETKQVDGDKMRAAEEFSNALRQATGIAKAPYVAEFVRLLLENGEPVVLFGWHRAVYEIWLEKLKAFNPVLYTGSESATAKQESLSKFTAKQTDLFIMSLRSGAGVDGLQSRCRTVVIGELDWSPAVLEQCIGRIYRDGQADPVTAYFLTSDDGADPMMSETLGLKRDQIEGIIGRSSDSLVERDESESGIKRLAEDFLKRHKSQRTREVVGA